jgi:mRNA deadenylase 3'-5' endonuclease subunit Ccr4
MELKSMIDFVFYIGNLDIARKSSHKEMEHSYFNYALLLKRQTIPMDVCL